MFKEYLKTSAYIESTEWLLENRPKALKELSYLYRLQNRYDEEQELVQNALNIGVDKEYFFSRQKWHGLSLFEKLEPRPPLHLPRDSKYIPKQESLEKLCIVTAGGSDTPYWELCIELLESIENTRFYGDIPIYIFDCGFEEDHKDYLLRRFKNIKQIRDPGWDLECNFDYRRGSLNGLKGCMARGFINEHFPGHQYYLWLDNDTWVHDERALDRLVCLAERQGIGCVINKHDKNTKIKDIPFYFTNIFPELVHIKENIACSNGVFCAEHDFFEKWQKFDKEAVSRAKKYVFGYDSASYRCALGQYEIQEILYGKTHFAPRKENLPLIDGKHILCYPKDNEPLGIIHFVEKKTYIHELKEINSKNTTLASIHFRNWPWKEDKNLKEELFNVNF